MRFLNRKVPMVTQIKKKQEQVRSNPKGGELRGRGEGRLIDPTRRTGELDGLIDPTRPFIELNGWVDSTRPFGELDGVVCPTRRTGELVGASGPTSTFGELDDGCFPVRDPLS